MPQCDREKEVSELFREMKENPRFRRNIHILAERIRARQKAMAVLQ